MGYITPTLVSNWLAVSFMLPQLPRDIKWHLTLTFFSVLHFTIYISEMSSQDYDSDDFCVTMDEEGEEQGEVGEEQGEVDPIGENLSKNHFDAIGENLSKNLSIFEDLTPFKNLNAMVRQKPSQKTHV